MKNEIKTSFKRERLFLVVLREDEPEEVLSKTRQASGISIGTERIYKRKFYR